MLADVKIVKRITLDGNALFNKLEQFYRDNDEENDDRYYDKETETPMHGIISWPVTLSLSNEVQVKRMYKSFFTKGYHQSTYCYNDIELPFKSYMLRWENLNFCGGWGMEGFNDKKLIKAVIKRKKPFGIGLFKSGKDVEDIIQMVEESGLPYSVEINKNCNGYENVSVCQHGTIGELFDLKSFIESYKILLEGVNDDINYEYFENLRDVELKMFLKDWEYYNPRNDTELARTGLLLGYPIESTASLIRR